LDYVREGDTLVVWRFDRLARSLKDLVQLIASLEEKGVSFASVTESIDTASPGGKLIFHIFGALAEFERNLIRERTKAGLNAARARGREGGRPKSLKEDDERLLKTLIQNPQMKPKDIQKMFGISKATLYRYAKLNQIQTQSQEGG
jgi:DNA invertase Pin-like site-specific DNA recombinase